MRRYKMLALDVDGTLLDSSGKIRPRVGAAITRAMEAGMLVTLATGRSYRQTQGIARKLQLTAPLVVSNGSVVMTPDAGQILLYRPLTCSLASKAIRAIRSKGLSPHALCWAHTGPDLLYDEEPRLPRIANPLAQDPHRARQVDDLCDTVASLQPLRILTLDRSAAVVPVAGDISRSLGQPHGMLVSEETPGYSLLEISSPGTSKATGLDHICTLSGIHPSEVVAIGDNLNDLEMLRFAGLGVAMGNAKVEVKAAADVVTAANDDDGVAVFLERRLFQVA